MILVNFSHPLNKYQMVKIEELTGRSITRVLNTSDRLDQYVPFTEQIRRIIDDTGLSLHEWQTSTILINPPPYSPFATILMAELHGRMGQFPTIIRIRPTQNDNPTQFEIGEIIDLQAVRKSARTNRML